jgi:DNA repair exonuclease SbcCD ATPase subunit
MNEKPYLSAHDKIKQLEAQNKVLQAELDWWHELINKHHKNVTCPDLRTYVEQLQAEVKELKAWRARYDAGAAERRWKALGGSW